MVRSNISMNLTLMSFNIFKPSHLSKRILANKHCFKHELSLFVKNSGVISFLMLAIFFFFYVINKTCMSLFKRVVLFNCLAIVIFLKT